MYGHLKLAMSLASTDAFQRLLECAVTQILHEIDCRCLDPDMLLHARGNLQIKYLLLVQKIQPHRCGRTEIGLFRETECSYTEKQSDESLYYITVQILLVMHADKERSYPNDGQIIILRQPDTPIRSGMLLLWTASRMGTEHNKWSLQLNAR